LDADRGAYVVPLNAERAEAVLFALDLDMEIVHGCTCNHLPNDAMRLPHPV